MRAYWEQHRQICHRQRGIPQRVASKKQNSLIKSSCSSTICIQKTHDEWNFPPMHEKVFSFFPLVCLFMICACQQRSHGWATLSRSSIDKQWRFSELELELFFFIGCHTKQYHRCACVAVSLCASRFSSHWHKFTQQTQTFIIN